MAIQSNFPSLKPTLLLDFANTKQLDPRITFTRASTAKYYDGVTTAKAEENLITYSQSNYDTSWNNNSTSIVVNSSAAPDGTATAALVSEVAATSYHFLSSNSVTITAGLPYTQSLFAKAGTVGVIQLVFAGTPFGTAAYANFDLSTGALGTVGSSATATITSVGSGWYRCTITATATSTASSQNGVIVGLCNNSTTASRLPSYAGNTTNNVYIWGAQLEQRSAVTAYTATTTQAITNYIPALQTAASGVARFDHNPTTGESLGLLIEEQRTNLLTYSEQFDNAAWSASAVTVTANTEIAPDGTLTAEKLISTTASGFHAISQALASKTASTAYTFSFYAKAGEIGHCVPNFSMGLTGSALSCTINLFTGAVTGVSAGLTASTTSVGNGWWKIAITATGAANTTGFGSVINTTDAAGTASHTGNGYSGIYIWGAQLEAGGFATSYIATTSAQVTRSADAASMTGTNFSSWYRADEGTLYADFNPGVSSSATDGTGVARGVACISDNTINNRIRIASGLNGYIVVAAGVTVSNITIGSVSANTNYKIAVVYKTNDFQAAIDAVFGTADTSGSIPVVNRIDIGNSSNAGAGVLNGTIKKIAYYPARVTNAQLQALTS